MDIVSYLLAKGYTNKKVAGLTEIRGKDCTIDSIDTSDNSKAVITFKWYDEDSSDYVTQDLEIPYMNMKNVYSITSEKETTEHPNVTTVTITLRDGSTEEFEITDGLGIKDVSMVTAGNNHTITVTYDDDTTKDLTFTRANKWFSGNTSPEIASISPIIGDFYFRTSNNEVSEYKTVEGVTKWYVVANLQGSEGKSAYEVWLIDNPGKTRADFILAISGDGIQMERVWKKPDIRDRSTDVNKWYFYQDNDEVKKEETLLRFTDTGSYTTLGGYVSDNCLLEAGKTYYWKAWMEGKSMCLTIPATIGDISLYLGDTVAIVYDIASSDYDDYIPSSIRPYSNGHIVKVSATGEKVDIGSFTNSSSVDVLTRVDEGEEPEDAIDLATLIGSDIYGEEVTNVLCMTTAWKGISNFSLIPEDGLTAGPKAVWNGSKYVCFVNPLTLPDELNSMYLGGIALFTDETQDRGWIIGALTDDVDSDLVILGGFGAAVTYASEVPTGYSDWSTIFDTYDQMGIYFQTIFIGNSKANADEVTLSVGSATAGSFVSDSLFQEVTGYPNTVWRGSNIINAINRAQIALEESVSMEGGETDEKFNLIKSFTYDVYTSTVNRTLASPTDSSSNFIKDLHDQTPNSASRKLMPTVGLVHDSIKDLFDKNNFDFDEDTATLTITLD